MGTDDSGLTDEVQVVLNPEPEPSGDPADYAGRPPLPARPAGDASREDWVAYVVALGADESYVSGDTEHWEGDLTDGESVVHPALTDAELVELADTLGG